MSEHPPRPVANTPEQRKADARASLESLEQQAAHPTPGALKQDLEAQILEQEHAFHEAEQDEVKGRIAGLEKAAAASPGKSRVVETEVLANEALVHKMETQAPGASESRKEWRTELFASVNKLQAISQERWKQRTAKAEQLEGSTLGIKIANTPHELTKRELAEVRARLHQLHSSDLFKKESAVTSPEKAGTKTTEKTPAANDNLDWNARVAKERAQLEAEDRERRTSGITHLGRTAKRKGPLVLQETFESPERRAAREIIAQETAGKAQERYLSAYKKQQAKPGLFGLGNGEVKRLKEIADKAKREYVHEKTYDKPIADRARFLYGNIVKPGAEGKIDVQTEASVARGHATAKTYQKARGHNPFRKILLGGLAASVGLGAAAEVPKAFKQEKPAVPATRTHEKPVAHFETVTASVEHSGEGAEKLFVQLKEGLKKSGNNSSMAEYLLKKNPAELATIFHFLEKDAHGMMKSGVMHPKDSFSVNDQGQLIFHRIGQRDHVLMHMAHDAKGKESPHIDGTFYDVKGHVSRAAGYAVHAPKVTTAEKQKSAAIPATSAVEPSDALNQTEAAKGKAANAELQARVEAARAASASSVTTEMRQASPHETAQAETIPTEHAAPAAPVRSAETVPLPSAAAESLRHSQVLEDLGAQSSLDLFTDSADGTPQEIQDFRKNLYALMRETGIGPTDLETVTQYIDRAASAAPIQQPVSIIETPDNRLIARGGDLNARLMLGKEYSRMQSEQGQKAPLVWAESPETQELIPVVGDGKAAPLKLSKVKIDPASRVIF